MMTFLCVDMHLMGKCLCCLPSRRLVHPAVDDDFVVSQNAPNVQVLVLLSRRLVHPAVDDDFVVRRNAPYG